MSMNLLARIQEQQAWWRRENAVPLVKNWYPEDLPFGGLDRDVPVAEIATRKLRNAEAQNADPARGDWITTANVNFATALYPATAGAAYAFDEHTSWTIPTVEKARDIRIGPFDPSQPLYAQYRERLEAVLARWSWDTYVPVTSGYDGVGDILAGFLGPEILAVEMLDNPDDVRAAAEAAADFMSEVITFERSLFESAGVLEPGWMVNLFNTVSPGWSGLIIEDFSALVGPDHYREFLFEPDRRIAEQLDSALFHTHSAAFRSMPEMLNMPRHVAFEFGNDPSGPGTRDRLAAARAILADGRPLTFGSWDIPQPRETMEQVVCGLNAQGLDLRFQCSSPQEAIEVRQWVKDHPHWAETS